MKTFKTLIGVSICLALAAIVLFSPSTSAAKPPKAQNGTTLAAYKTLDICEAVPAAADGTTPAIWRYSGVIAVWNEGAVDTIGLNITDFIENKPYTSKNRWFKAYDVPVIYSGEIPAGTTQLTALTFTYSVDGPALPGYIRNNVKVTILNHSNYIGTPFGPNPKVTYTGPVPPLPCEAFGCTYTQGYWSDKPGVVWPTPYSRDAYFFLSGQTWQQVLDTPVNVSQGYYQLAHQYIAAVLNATGASVPDGVQETLDLAEEWLTVNVPYVCTGPGSCGYQKDWAAVLDLYNNGLYPGGPPHCGEVVPAEVSTP